MGETDERFVTIGDASLRAIQKYKIPSVLLDIGCGYGRLAYALHRDGFQGRYVGVDVLSRHIDWLSSNFKTKVGSYEFYHADVQNDRYNKSGAISADRFLPPNAELLYDVVAVFSVFTHMYEQDIASYMAAASRVMSDDAVIVATFFLLGSPAARPFTFQHKMNEHCYYFSESDPLHAISYSADWVESEARKAGLELLDISYDYQDRLCFRKA